MLAMTSRPARRRLSHLMCVWVLALLVVLFLSGCRAGNPGTLSGQEGLIGDITPVPAPVATDTVDDFPEEAVIPVAASPQLAFAGDYLNLAEHTAGHYELQRSGEMVMASITTTRSPVQYWAREVTVPLFIVPPAFRPPFPVIRTVKGQPVHADGTPSQGYFLRGNRWVRPDRRTRPVRGRARRGWGDCDRRCEGGKAPWGRQGRWGGPRGAEDRGGRGVERAMEECDAGPAPRARVGSGAAGVQPAQARAEVGTGRRSQPHAGPQIAAQQQAAQQRHALLQEAVAARGQRILVGRVQLGGGPAQAPGLPVAGLRFLAARAVGHGQQGGNRQHQPVAAHARGIQAARLVPLPADGFQAPEALLNPVRQAYRVGSVSATGVSVSSTQGCA